MSEEIKKENATTEEEQIKQEAERIVELCRTVDSLPGIWHTMSNQSKDFKNHITGVYNVICLRMTELIAIAAADLMRHDFGMSFNLDASGVQIPNVIAIALKHIKAGEELEERISKKMQIAPEQHSEYLTQQFISRKWEYYAVSKDTPNA